ncbi:MAG: zinc ribbon domain-containing protein [Verrucomicrobiae bacterium]|nr:zinc ribbon domain-containing protein [Verrucomicrobiae bacterium]
MPTYEYECGKCGKTFETVQSMKDAPLSTCPKEKCRRKSWGKGRVKRLLSPGAGLIFKGSGFYITDYRSEGYKQAAKKEKEATAPSPKKEGGDAGAAKKDSATKSVKKAKD